MVNFVLAEVARVMVEKKTLLALAELSYDRGLICAVEYLELKSSQASVKLRLGVSSG